MTLRAVFFDLDGTLLDTANDLASALNALLEANDKSTLPLSTIRKVVSDGAAALINLGFSVTEHDENYPKLRENLLEFYLANISVHTEAFEGIPHLIEELTKLNIKWGIVTNKPWAYTKPLMEQFTFASNPVAVICPDHVEHKKPHPEALKLACQQASCHPTETIYVGDHQRDIECGMRAGSKTISVGYGYIPDGDSHTNWKANHTVNHASELWPIIKTYIKNHEVTP